MEMLDLSSPLPLNGPPDREAQMISELQVQCLRYQELFDFAPDAYLVTDRFGVILQANHAAAQLLQTPREFLCGKPLPLFVAADRLGSFYGRLTSRLTPGAVHHWETAVQVGRKQPRHVAVSVAYVASGGPDTPLLRWLLRDVSDVKLADQAFHEQKDLADTLLENVEALVLIIDARGCILRANPYVREITGHAWSELCGSDWCGLLIAGEDIAAAGQLLDRARLEGRARGGVLDVLTRTQGRRAVTWSARALAKSPARFVLVGHDVTDLQASQKRALQAERLAALGEMVAGLAHESRNALQRTQACLTLLGYRLQDQPEALALVERIQSAQDDLSRVFNEVREYAAPIALELRLCNLGALWHEVWSDVVPARAGAEFRHFSEFALTEPRCVVSPFHIKQVFRNILENAFNATGSATHIKLRYGATTLAGRPAVSVAIRDNGPGFTAERRHRAFEPFYTTNARGTGLGLAICKRLVEAHHGTIAIAEPDGKGAEIIVTLPRRRS